MYSYTVDIIPGENPDIRDRKAKRYTYNLVANSHEEAGRIALEKLLAERPDLKDEQLTPFTFQSIYPV